MSEFQENEELTNSFEEQSLKNTKDLLALNDCNNKIINNLYQNSEEELDYNLSKTINSNDANDNRQDFEKNKKLINIEENNNKNELEKNNTLSYSSGRNSKDPFELKEENQHNNNLKNITIENNNKNENENDKNYIESIIPNKSIDIKDNTNNLKDENIIEIYNINNKRKTFFNYDEDFEAQEKKFIENNNINKESNNNESIKKDKLKPESNIIINFNKNYSFGNRDLNENESQTAHFHKDTIIHKEEKEFQEINNIPIKNKHKILLTKPKNNLINSKDYFFNYRNDEIFNKINILGTKMEEKNMKIANKIWTIH